MAKRILVWLSWGVDSAVSAYLLKKQWYDVTAWFMINYLDETNPNCPTKQDIGVAKEVATYLEIPFFTFDYREEYEKKVLDYMFEWYSKWITPNPDIMCNSEVKFKVFLDEALTLWFDGVATGHYAIISEDENHIFHLKKWVDESKDQSYFLAWLNQFQLSKSIFPIWDIKKLEVRKIAKEIWLPNADKKDSQGICFVWKVDMADFLENRIKPKKWFVKDTSWKILWEHKWVFYYTIWQRKWLDIWGQVEPIFVVAKDIEKNEIIVWTSSDLELYKNELILYTIHFINPDFEASIKENWININCKIRYRQDDQKAILSRQNNVYKVIFEKSQRAIASGQICAIYIEDELVASGVIK